MVQSGVAVMQIRRATSEMKRGRLPSPGVWIMSAAVASCMLSVVFPVSALDFSIGGVSEIRFALDAGDGEERRDLGAFSFSPLLAISGGGSGSEIAWEALVTVQGEGKTDPAGLSFRVTASHLRYWLGDSFSFRAGYFNDAAAAAELFPLTSFFGPAERLSFLERGGESRVRGFEPLVEARYAISGWRMSLLFAPFQSDVALPDIDSPWFPDEEIPSSFVFAGQTYRRGDLAYYIGDSGNFPRFEPSWKFGAGLSAGSFELDLAYFHGRDRRTLFTGMTDSMESAYTFDVLLVPESAVVDVVALAMTGVFGDVRAYAEAAYGMGGLFATGSYEFSGIHIDKATGRVSEMPPAMSAKEAAATFGALWRTGIAGFPVSAMAEFTWSLLLGVDSTDVEVEDLEQRDFSRAGAVLVSVQDPRGKFEFSTALLLSCADWSYAVRPSLRFEIGPDDELTIVAPFYFGDAGSELGRYAALRYLMAGITHRF